MIIPRMVQPISLFPKSNSFNSSTFFKKNTSSYQSNNVEFKSDYDMIEYYEKYYNNNSAQKDGNTIQISDTNTNNINMSTNSNNNIINQNQENDFLINKNLENIQQIENTQNQKNFKNVFNLDIKNEPVSKKSTQEKTEENNNAEDAIETKKKKKTKHDYRNYPIQFVNNFFNDLIIFINSLITSYNSNTKENIEYLHNLDKTIYIEHERAKALKQLTQTAKVVLDPLNPLNTKSESIKTQSYANKILSLLESNRNLLNKIIEQNEITNVITVLNTNIEDLMNIYLMKVDLPKESFYNSFHKYKDCAIYKKKDEEGKKDLMYYANNYKDYLSKKRKRSKN